MLLLGVSVSTVQQDHSQLIMFLLGVNATTIQQDIFLVGGQRFDGPAGPQPVFSS